MKTPRKGWRFRTYVWGVLLLYHGEGEKFSIENDRQRTMTHWLSDPLWKKYFLTIAGVTPGMEQRVDFPKLHPICGSSPSSYQHANALVKRRFNRKLGCTARVCQRTQVEKKCVSHFIEQRTCSGSLNHSHGYRCCSQWDERGHARKPPWPIRRDKIRIKSTGKIFSLGSFSTPKSSLFLLAYIGKRACVMIESIRPGTHASWSQ